MNARGGFLLKTFPQPLSAREEREYLERYKEGDREAREVLIHRNMRLVAHIVKKYQGVEEELDDLLDAFKKLKDLGVEAIYTGALYSEYQKSRIDVKGICRKRRQKYRAGRTDSACPQ